MLKQIIGKWSVVAVGGTILVLSLSIAQGSSHAIKSTDGSGTGESGGLAPGYYNATIQRKLDQAMSIPGMHGVVRGTVGSGRTFQIPSRDIVTDYEFTVTDARPSARPPYRLGLKMSIRVQGGCIGQLCGGSSSPGPNISTGDELVAFVRDQGTIYGGNSQDRLILSSPYDVFVIRNGLARGQGEWTGYTEPVGSLMQRFGS